MADRRSRAVLFDLDGTLVDSFSGIAEAYRHLFAELHLGEISDEQLVSFVGPPIRQVLREHFGLTGSTLEEGIDVFRSHYGKHGLLKFAKYPGVDDLLQTLHERSVLLYVATSKMSVMALSVVEHAGWAELFSFVGGSEAGDGRYRKEDVVRWTMSHVPDGTSVIAMVGDRADDISSARSVGIPSIGVMWGYAATGELVRARAHVLANTPNEVLSALISMDEDNGGRLQPTPVLGALPSNTQSDD